ncbi:MAG TPA: FtsQ-type POTRA domain-containing protein [Actinomycetota bacterium]|nr:FtsQ-type POTRA domain-containing protein [Actinomycetota bacterium]
MVRDLTTRFATARWPAALVGLVVLGAAAWWVTNSAIFNLRTLEIRGNAHLTKAHVARVGDLTGEVNVLWTLPGTIERRLESHPRIREAHVSRTLPSTLTVVIKERRPVAVLPESGAIVGPDGKVLGTKKQGGALPLISTTPGVGGQGKILAEDGLAVARAMPPKLRSLVQDITVGDAEGIQLRLRDGTVVTYGDRSEMALKAAVLRSVLQWSESTGTNAKSIDVSVPTAPTVVPTEVIQPPA